MPQKKHKAEEIVAKLRQVDVLLSQGRSVGEAVRSIGVTQFTYYPLAQGVWWRIVYPASTGAVWSYDFVEGRTHNGRKFRMLNIIDEFTRECLAIRIDRKLNSTATAFTRSFAIALPFLGKLGTCNVS